MSLSKFDPWRSSLCTCPYKLTFNPYTGCDHQCVYCYASSYIPNFYAIKPKKDIIRRLERASLKLEGQIVSMCNSSDPYPALEEKLGLTRKCLQILRGRNCKIQIITKSDLVTRDIDILKRSQSIVAMTVTTLDEDLSKRLEPKAPTPTQRIKALEMLAKERIPTSARIDPIIPFLNDDPNELIETLGSIGVKHITSSTYKVKPDNWKRFEIAFPEIAKRLKPIYERGEKTSGYLYLPRELRYALMKDIKQLAEQNRMSFGVCREGFAELNSAVCDGSALYGTKAG